MTRQVTIFTLLLAILVIVVYYAYTTGWLLYVKLLLTPPVYTHVLTSEAPDQSFRLIIRREEPEFIYENPTMHVHYRQHGTLSSPRLFTTRIMLDDGAVPSCAVAWEGTRTAIITFSYEGVAYERYRVTATPRGITWKSIKGPFAPSWSKPGKSIKYPMCSY